MFLTCVAKIEFVIPILGLSEFLSHSFKTGFTALLNSLILAKCFRAKLWENSPYISKQLEKIGEQTAMLIYYACRHAVVFLRNNKLNIFQLSTHAVCKVNIINNVLIIHYVFQVRL